MISLKRFSFFVLFICISGACSADDAHIRILGVGNSFTANSMRFLPEIIESNPELSADVAYAYIGGCPLDKHVTLAHAHEADSTEGEAYRYWRNGQTIKKDTSLQAILEDGPWDYITIQQVSSKSYKIETYYPYAEQLISYIKKYAPDAKIVIHETWAHSIDSYRVKEWDLLPDDMYAKLHEAYGQISEEYDLRVIPVGTAFQNAKKLSIWDYQPTSVDVKSLKYADDKDALPDESKSLHKIFYWTNKGGTWNVGNDGYHANQHGEYLGGMVWYEFFFKQDAREITYKPEGFSDEQAATLRAVAHETVDGTSVYTP